MEYKERITLRAALAAVLGRQPTAPEWTRLVEVWTYGIMFPEPQADLEARLAQWAATTRERYPD